MFIRYAASTKCSVPFVIPVSNTLGTEHFVVAAYLIHIFKQIKLIRLPYNDTVVVV